jgi:hypothetical protein
MRVEDVPSIRTFANQKLEFVVEDLIVAGGITMVSGDSGSGKSSVVTKIGHCVAHGIPFADLAVQQRPVLYLDRENPIPIVVERLDRLNLDDSPPNFVYWGGWVNGPAPAPGSGTVLEWVASCNPKPVIMVDALAGFHGGDENDAADTEVFMAQLRQLSHLGATVILLHNIGKAETSKLFRGSQRIKDGVDAGFCLTNLGEPLRLETLRLKAFKGRCGVLPELMIHYAGGRFERDAHGPVKTEKEALRDLLIANPGVATKRFEDLASEKGLGRNRAREFCAEGVLAGTIRRDMGGNYRKFFTWIGSQKDAGEELFSE